MTTLTAFGPSFLQKNAMASKAKYGPIILVDDDLDDQEIAKDVIKTVGRPNEVITFNSTNDAFTYLMENLDVQPFIILSDVNLPHTSGIGFKQRIDNTPVLRQKSIPFVFYSTSADKPTVDKAYQYAVQGFFVKGNSVTEMAGTLRLIFDYWTQCRHPNS